ncbi:MAG: CotH kinase family protein [Bacteroidaceae bacterium]|nr:CotH kinase family protein [Bacteroidaceae bacterium]
MTRKIVLLLLLLLGLNGSAQTQTYKRVTNLPHLYITTEGRRAITSKTEYVNSTMWLVNEQDAVVEFDSVGIRGRGNSTWGLAKKPYKFKFPIKQKLLGKGYAKAKKWTLLANAGDKTLMRNAVTREMGEWLGMKNNPAAKFVDVTLNGTFQGNYQISDQVEVKAHRVNITEQDFPLTQTSDITGGYLLEVDGFADGNTFWSSHGLPIRIHYPEDEEIAASQNQYIRQYVNNFETVLFGADFMDAEKGYRPWVDSLSLAGWLIATEVSANIDGYYSTYFYKDQQDSALYFGPLWDYDIAYDNDYRISGNVRRLMSDDGYGETKKWVNQMWKDPWFGQLICNRYREVMEGGMKEYLMEKIDSLSDLLQESQQLNYQKWGIQTRMYHEVVLYSSYDQYVQDLKSFIDQHMDFLATAFEAKRVKAPTPPFHAERFFYTIRNQRTGTVFDTDAGRVCGWADVAERPSQEWVITPVGDYFFIQNRADSLALNDPTEGETTPTTNVGTQLALALPDSTDLRQLWTLQPQGTDLLYNLINAATGHTANLSGGGSGNGTPILSYTTNAVNATSGNRLWRFTPTEPLPDDGPATGIAPVPEPDDYALAYNPVLQQLHFGAAHPEELCFTANVYASNGTRLRTFRASETLSVADLPAGVYIVSWRVDGRVRSAKFSK